MDLEEMGFKDGDSSMHDDKCSCFIKNEVSLHWTFPCITDTQHILIANV